MRENPKDRLKKRINGNDDEMENFDKFFDEKGSYPAVLENNMQHE